MGLVSIKNPYCAMPQHNGSLQKRTIRRKKSTWTQCWMDRQSEGQRDRQTCTLVRKSPSKLLSLTYVWAHVMTNHLTEWWMGVLYIHPEGPSDALSVQSVSGLLSLITQCDAHTDNTLCLHVNTHTHTHDYSGPVVLSWRQPSPSASLSVTTVMLSTAQRLW